MKKKKYCDDISTQDVKEDMVKTMNSVLSNFYEKKLIERATAKDPFLTDVEVEETVPKYYIRIPVPYLRSSYDYEYGERNKGEFVFGIEMRTLFTIGKKKVKRFLYTWELPKNKRKVSVIKFKRYGDLNAEQNKMD